MKLISSNLARSRFCSSFNEMNSSLIDSAVSKSSVNEFVSESPPSLVRDNAPVSGESNRIRIPQTVHNVVSRLCLPYLKRENIVQRCAHLFGQLFPNAPPLMMVGSARLGGEGKREGGQRGHNNKIQNSISGLWFGDT